MINMNMQYLQKTCDYIHQILCDNYPKHKWAVLPEVEGSCGSMGLYIATTTQTFYNDQGEPLTSAEPVTVVSRIHTRITEPEKLVRYFQDPEIICAVFEKFLTGTQDRFGHKREGLSYVMSPSAASSAASSAPISFPK